MGEIGRPRHEFLYEIDFWEVRRIIRGYRQRDTAKLILLRLTAYFAKYATRDNKEGITPQQFFPMAFDEADKEETPPVSDDEVAQMRDMIRRINKKNGVEEKAEP